MHCILSVLPRGEREFSEQLAHVSALIAAKASEYVLEGHRVQNEEPFMCLYVPRVHAMHGPAFAPLKPLLHRQCSARMLPSGELLFGKHGKHSELELAPVAPKYVPAAHLMHVTRAVTGAYEPAPHFTHKWSPTFTLCMPASQAVHALPADSGSYPALQIQLDCSFVPAASVVIFGGQLRQTLSDTAPTSEAYLPMVQSVHSCGPDSGLKLAG